MSVIYQKRNGQLVQVSPSTDVAKRLSDAEDKLTKLEQAGGFTLEPATTDKLGGVKTDGTTTFTDTDGTFYTRVSGSTLSDAAPQPFAPSASAGVSVEISRADHVHEEQDLQMDSGCGAENLVLSADYVMDGNSKRKLLVNATKPDVKIFLPSSDDIAADGVAYIIRCQGDYDVTVVSSNGGAVGADAGKLQVNKTRIYIMTDELGSWMSSEWEGSSGADDVTEYPDQSVVFTSNSAFKPFLPIKIDEERCFILYCGDDTYAYAVVVGIATDGTTILVGKPLKLEEQYGSNVSIFNAVKLTDSTFVALLLDRTMSGSASILAHNILNITGYTVTLKGTSYTTVQTGVASSALQPSFTSMIRLTDDTFLAQYHHYISGKTRYLGVYCGKLSTDGITFGEPTRYYSQSLGTNVSAGDKNRVWAPFGLFRCADNKAIAVSNSTRSDATDSRSNSGLLTLLTIESDLTITSSLGQSINKVISFTRYDDTTIFLSEQYVNYYFRAYRYDPDTDTIVGAGAYSTTDTVEGTSGGLFVTAMRAGSDFSKPFYIILSGGKTRVLSYDSSTRAFTSSNSYAVNMTAAYRSNFAGHYAYDLNAITTPDTNETFFLPSHTATLKKIALDNIGTPSLVDVMAFVSGTNTKSSAGVYLGIIRLGKTLLCFHNAKTADGGANSRVVAISAYKYTN